MAKKKSNRDPNREREALRYEHPVPSREYIIQYLQGHARPVTNRHLVKAFNLDTPEEQEGLRRRLIAMVRDGQLLVNRKGSYALIDKMDLVRGVVQGHRDGFGFLIPDQGGSDIFLPAREMRGVFTDDVVLVRVMNGHGSKREGVIVEVIDHQTHSLVGRYFEENDVAFLQPDNKTIAQDILIVDKGDQDVLPGDYVIVDLVSQPTKRRHATASIREVLGNELTPGMEAQLAAYAHGIPFEWPELVLAEAADIPAHIADEDLVDREDYRDLPFVTIDGADSRDFDDAVYAKKRRLGGWVLYVAIADVAEYVRQNTALDAEGYTRGNSVYFPNEVIPMLPERLSNGICSLNPDVDRLVLVCEMTIEEDGVIKRHRLREGVINSHARLTYTEVAEVLSGIEESNHPRRDEIATLHAVYQSLLEQRQERGAIEFETEEPIFHFNSQGKIDSISVRRRNVAHRIIEEAMLAANVSVANYLESSQLPFLYRVHEQPDEEKLANLREFLANFSLRLGGRDEPSAQDYAKLVERVLKRSDSHLIETMVLRSLQKAVYSPENLGHFGLAYESYCHFTSPIRRYPDLLVHRAIKHRLQRRRKQEFPYAPVDFVVFGEHLSTTERRADRATREAMDRLKCEYMQDKLGEVFSGRIVEVTGFGLFVELDDIYVQGLVHITALENDYYEFDDVQRMLRGKRSNRIYRLGESITVLVAKVDLDDKTIDFVLPDNLD